VHFLGKRSGVSLVMKMAQLAADDRKTLGEAVNRTKREIEMYLASRIADLSSAELNARLQAEAVDVTLPGTVYARGFQHPLLKQYARCWTSLGRWDTRSFEDPKLNGTAITLNC
jgi:phenylalanyl-tRNA synthetase alpha chain